jgi:hypothetical protein
MYLDGFIVMNPTRLFYYWLNDVEYIEINLQDTSGGLLNGIRGTIRITTDPLMNAIKKTTVKSFKFPITFSKSKKFYVPKYQSLKSNFYKNYGVIDWLPLNRIEENKILTIKMKNNNQNKVKLFIEGVTEEGKFISQEITVNTLN